MDFESECRQIINVIGAVLMQILSGSGPRSLRFSHVDTARLPRLNMVGTIKKDTTSPCQKPQCIIMLKTLVYCKCSTNDAGPPLKRCERQLLGPFTVMTPVP